MAAHFSLGVEYALHSLLFLVDREQAGRAASTRDLADLQKVPPEYLAKLFTRLQKAGLTTSIEGIGGGVRLARSACDITVLDVVRAIDGAKPLFDCREVRRGCALFNGEPPKWSITGPCSIHAIMLDAQARMEAVLATRSLLDIADQVNAKAPAEFSNDVAAWLDKRATRRGKKQENPI